MEGKEEMVQMTYLDDYMKSQGYTFYGKQSYDHMFVKNDLI